MPRGSRSESFIAGYAAARRDAAHLVAQASVDPAHKLSKLEQAIRRLEPQVKPRPGAQAPKEMP